MIQRRYLSSLGILKHNEIGSFPIIFNIQLFVVIHPWTIRCYLNPQKNSQPQTEKHFCHICSSQSPKILPENHYRLIHQWDSHIHHPSLQHLHSLRTPLHVQVLPLMMPKSSISRFIQMNLHGLIQATARLRIGSFRWLPCGVSHEVFDNKVNEWISKNRENLVVRARMSRVYVPPLGFCRFVYIGLLQQPLLFLNGESKSAQVTSQVFNLVLIGASTVPLMICNRRGIEWQLS